MLPHLQKCEHSAESFCISSKMLFKKILAKSVPMQPKTGKSLPTIWQMYFQIYFGKFSKIEKIRYSSSQASLSPLSCGVPPPGPRSSGRSRRSIGRRICSTSVCFSQCQCIQVNQVTAVYACGCLWKRSCRWDSEKKKHSRVQGGRLRASPDPAE